MPSERIDMVEDVRGFLRRMSAEITPTVVAPRPVIRRARRRVAVTSIAGLLVLASVGYGAVAAVDAVRGWDRTMPAGRPAAPFELPLGSSNGSEPGSASEFLTQFVLKEFRGPSLAIEFEDYGEEVWTAEDLADVLHIPLGRLRRAWFVDGYGSAWATPGWFGSGDGPALDLISVAMLFADEPGAAEALRLILHPDRFDEGVDPWRVSPAPALGPEGFLCRGEIDGMPTIGYTWRVGRVVILVASQGALRQPVMRTLAEQLAARVG